MFFNASDTASGSEHVDNMEDLTFDNSFQGDRLNFSDCNSTKTRSIFFSSAAGELALAWDSKNICGWRSDWASGRDYSPLGDVTIVIAGDEA